MRFDDSCSGIGLDSSLTFINSVARTKLFACTDVASIALFRVIYLFFQSEDLHNLGITDTCTWVVELMDKNDGHIATIDSITMYPSVAGLSMPCFGPDSIGFCSLNVACQSHEFGPDDSAYVRLVLTKQGTGSPGYTGRDRLHAHEKLSSTFGLPAEKRGEQRGRDFDAMVHDETLRIMPNPARNKFLISVELIHAATFRLELFDAQGKRVSILYGVTCDDEYYCP